MVQTKARRIIKDALSKSSFRRRPDSRTIHCLAPGLHRGDGSGLVQILLK